MVVDALVVVTDVLMVVADVLMVAADTLMVVVAGVMVVVVVEVVVVVIVVGVLAIVAVMIVLVVVVVVLVVVVAVLMLWPWHSLFSDGDVALPCWCCCCEWVLCVSGCSIGHEQLLMGGWSSMVAVVFAGPVQSSFLPPKSATMDHNRSRTNPDIEGNELNHLGPVFCSPWCRFRPIQTGIFA